MSVSSEPVTGVGIANRKHEKDQPEGQYDDVQHRSAPSPHLPGEQARAALELEAAQPVHATLSADEVARLAYVFEMEREPTL